MLMRQVSQTLEKAMNATEVMMFHPEISKAEAQSEIKKHDADWGEFVSEYGDHDQYDGADVLIWLGY
jgi:hypothetical protein